MAETAQEFSDFETIFDLLESIGFADARKPENSSSENLTSGITWSIATINGTQIGGNKIDDWERIEEDLRLIGCPFSLQASHVPRLDGEAVFSVVQWLASRIRGMSDHSKSQQTKDTVLNEMKCLQEEIFKADAHDVVQNLMTCSKTLKDLEKQESEFLSTCNAKRQELKSEILELEEKLVRGYDCSSFIDSIDNSISQSQEKINSVKKALASRLRAMLALKRLLDDVPTQSELIQYERRFSELYVSIQGKLRQTRRYYATYNALLEIKDLMAKETSLLNSISSQVLRLFAHIIS